MQEHINRFGDLQTISCLCARIIATDDADKSCEKKFNGGTNSDIGSRVGKTESGSQAPTVLDNSSGSGRAITASKRWIGAYRELLNRSQLWQQRAAFDIGLSVLKRRDLERGITVWGKRQLQEQLEEQLQQQVLKEQQQNSESAKLPGSRPEVPKLYGKLPGSRPVAAQLTAPAVVRQNSDLPVAKVTGTPSQTPVTSPSKKPSWQMRLGKQRAPKAAPEVKRLAQSLLRSSVPSSLHVRCNFCQNSLSLEKNKPTFQAG